MGIDLGEFGLRQCAAGRAPRLIVGEEQPNLFQGEPGGFAQANYLEAAQNRAIVATLAARRYGWQWNIVPLLKIPGVTNVHRDLSVREKLRRARERGVWADSVIVRVELA
jgi:hypothetical protein